MRLFASHSQRQGKLEASLSFEAAKDEASLPTFRIVANTGVPMRVSGFQHPVIVNFKGAKFAKKTIPVIADHRTYLNARIGHTTTQVVDKEIVVEGIVSATTQDAKTFAKDAANGFPFQASIGADILKEPRFIEAGKTVTVNGQAYEGPLFVADKTNIYEVTVTLFGADDNTSSTVTLNRDSNVDFEAYLKDLCATLDVSRDELSDAQVNKAKAKFEASKKPSQTTQTVTANAVNEPPSVPTDQDKIRAYAELQAKEDKRIGTIRAKASEYIYACNDSVKQEEIEKLKAQAIEERWDIPEFELAALKASRPTPSSFQGAKPETLDTEAKALECALLKATGKVPYNAENRITGQKYGLEHWFDQKTLEASDGRDYRGISLQSLMDRIIRASGSYYTGAVRDKDFLRATVEAGHKLKASGFSTLNISNILENVMHKQMLSAFQAVETTYQFITQDRTLNDFRPHNFYRLSPDGAFRKVAQDGELKHITMTDTKRSIEADTYGAMLTLDYKTIRNNDLGGIVDQTDNFGRLGAQRVEESVYVTLLSNPDSFFSVGNGNLLSGAGSALATAGITAARARFRNQVHNGRPILTSPSIMLVPTTLEVTANNFWTLEGFQVGGGNTGDLVFTNNPHKGLFRPYVSPYINNTGITDQDGRAISGQSDTQWYLMANPSVLPAIIIGFLDGRKTPYIEQAETEFDVPRGLQIRAYFDWGVAMGDTQAAIKNVGA